MNSSSVLLLFLLLLGLGLQLMLARARSALPKEPNVTTLPTIPRRALTVVTPATMAPPPFEQPYPHEREEAPPMLRATSTGDARPLTRSRTRRPYAERTRRASLRQAVVMMELLGPPRAMRERGA